MSDPSKVVSFRISPDLYGWLTHEGAKHGNRSANDFARALLLERVYELSSAERLDTESPAALYSVTNRTMAKQIDDLTGTVQNLVDQIQQRRFE